MNADAARIYFPFFQVKVAGHVVLHTNKREQAHGAISDANAKPIELWRIHANGTAELLDRVPA